MCSIIDVTEKNSDNATVLKYKEKKQFLSKRSRDAILRSCRQQSIVDTSISCHNNATSPAESLLNTLILPNPVLMPENS